MRLFDGLAGLGKSHTIANLISHFLAHGKRILVTSQTPRALKVLHAKIPESLQPALREPAGQRHRLAAERGGGCPRDHSHDQCLESLGERDVKLTRSRDSDNCA